MTVIELTNEACGESLQGVTRQAIAENNSVIAGCNVHWLFRGSCVDLETGKHGIRWLIVRILTEAGAVFTGTESREKMIAKSLFTAEIVSKVRSVNGFDKYPNQTIYDNLSTIMADQIGKIQLSNSEDQDRLDLVPKLKKPRTKWYLLA